MMSKRLLLTWAAVAAALTFAAGTAEAQAKIKMGAVLAVTGPASFLGDPEAKTLRMLADDINAKGGVLGERLEIVIYDSGGDATKARSFAQRLVGLRHRRARLHHYL
jgi:branched-chain amino acid transport system substrate-binding protein